MTFYFFLKSPSTWEDSPSLEVRYHGNGSESGRKAEPLGFYDSLRISTVSLPVPGSPLVRVTPYPAQILPRVGGPVLAFLGLLDSIP